MYSALPQRSAVRMKIKDLPFGVVWQLCRHLDSPHADRFSWRALLSHVPHSPYNAMDVGAFQRAGQRPNGSPTEAVLQDFIARGYTVDDLFLMLSCMEYVEGMKILQEHASPDHHHLLSQLLERNKMASLPKELPSPQGGGRQGMGSFEVDSRHGPLPPHNPCPERYDVKVVCPGEREGEGVKVGGERGGGWEKKKGMEGGVNGQLPHPPPQSQSGASRNGMVTAQPEGAPPPQPYHLSTSGYAPSHPFPQQATPTNHTPYNYPPAHSQPPSYGHPVHRSHMASTSGASSSSSEYPVFSPSVQSGSLASPNYSCTPLTQNSSGNSSVSSASNTNLTPSTPYSARSVSSASSDILLPNILHFSFSELSSATSGFTVGLVGMGSFGSVYKAMVRGNGPYAVKKLHNECEFEGEMFYEVFHRDTFLQELQMLTKYHHRNILSLVAYSNDGHRPCLVYEYMENGSLGDCLHRRRNVRLAWDVRLSIADQIADALHFLHTVNHPKCLVHGDVKSANILLDSHLVPRLSDFGLAHECSSRSSQHSSYTTKSEVIMGTVAYMAPEFFRNKKLLPKNDVYSFGVVLLELFTGLAADDPALSPRTLTERLSPLFEETVQPSDVAARGDPHAGWPGDVGCGLFDIATVCVREKARERPSMDQVKMQVSALVKEMSLDHLHISSPPQAPPPYYPRP